MRLSCEACDIERTYLVNIASNSDFVAPQIKHTCADKEGSPVCLEIGSQVNNFLIENSLNVDICQVIMTLKSILQDSGFVIIREHFSDDYLNCEFDLEISKKDKLQLIITYTNVSLDEELKILTKYKQTLIWSSIYLDDWDKNDWALLKTIPTQLHSVIKRSDRVSRYSKEIYNLILGSN